MVNDVVKFGEVFKPLEKRFKKLTTDQQGVYYEVLKHFDLKILDEVISNLVEEADYFPTPGKIKKACIVLRHNQIKARGDSDHLRSSCTRCRNGLVTVEYESPRRDGTMQKKWRSFHCAICNTDPHPSPQAVQIDDMVYIASQPSIKYPGCYIPDLKNKNALIDVTPLFTSKDLEDYYHGDKAPKPVAGKDREILDTLTQQIRDLRKERRLS
jgi:hypothetical protein